MIRPCYVCGVMCDLDKKLHGHLLDASIRLQTRAGFQGYARAVICQDCDRRHVSGVHLDKRPGYYRPRPLDLLS